MRFSLILPIAFFLSGLIVERIFFIKIPYVIFIALSLFLISLTFFIRSMKFLVIICLIFFVAGMFRIYSSLLMPQNDISLYLSDSPVRATIVGKIKDYPEKRDRLNERYQFTLKAYEVLIAGKEHPVKSNVLVRVYDRTLPYFFGDLVAVRGELCKPSGKRNPGGFNYRNYLFNKDITAIVTVPGKDNIMRLNGKKDLAEKIKTEILLIRKKTEKVIDEKIKYPASALVKAVFLGIKSGLTEEIKAPFVNTGTIHVMAISGLHIGLAIGTMLAVFNFFGWRKNGFYLLLILFVMIFIIFTGARIPVIRAGIMFVLMILGKMLYRKNYLVNSLAISAFIICFFMPKSILTTEFILSFTAVAAICFWDRCIKRERTFKNNNFSAKVSDIFSVSFVVWIGILPVIALNYDQVTPSVIIANILIVPLMYCLLMSSFVFAFTAFFIRYDLFTLLVGKVVETAAEITIFTARQFSLLPFSRVNVSSLSMWLVVIYYMFFVCLFLAGKKIKKRFIVILTVLFTANIFVWNDSFALRPDNFTVTFFDVGKADAALIETINGEVILIDGGTGLDENGKDCGRRILAPYLRKKRIRNIDLVILSHAHSDHAGGLEYILQNFKVNVFISGPGNENKLYKKLLNLLKQKGIRHILVSRGDRLTIGKDITIDVFNPPLTDLFKDLNNNSLVIRYNSLKNNTSILFTGDIENEAIEDLCIFGEKLNSDILKVPHHGSGNINKTIFGELLSAVIPEHAVITNKKKLSQKNNIFSSLEQQKVKIYTSQNNGAVIFQKEKGDIFINKKLN